MFQVLPPIGPQEALATSLHLHAHVLLAQIRKCIGNTRSAEFNLKLADPPFAKRLDAAAKNVDIDLKIPNKRCHQRLVGGVTNECDGRQGCAWTRRMTSWSGE
jgi:hypothetical protein